MLSPLEWSPQFMWLVEIIVIIATHFMEQASCLPWKLPTLKNLLQMIAYCSDIQMSPKKILFWALLMSLLFGCIETEWRLTVPFMVFLDWLWVFKLVVDKIYMLMNKSVMLAYSMIMHY
jgi:hypothetical protein